MSEELRQERDRYTVFARDGLVDLHCGNHTDNDFVKRIAAEEGKVDNNAVGIHGEEGDVSDCGVVDCSDSPVQNVDMGLHVVPVEQRERHVLRS